MNLRELLEEKKLGLTIFDIDETLMRTTAKIKVVKNGREVRSLTNQEFNSYQLKSGEEYDFGEFRNAEKFQKESEPIGPMIAKLKAILNNAGDSKVIMLTARADFDDKETFLDTFRKLGIDMNRVHVHRAGNLGGSPAASKAVWIRKYLDTGKYGRVRLYDDALSNIKMFNALAKEYPDIKFFPYLVTHDGRVKTVRESAKVKDLFENNNIIDNKNGWGAVPNNQEIDYLGLRVSMTPETFIKLASPLGSEPSEKIVQHIAQGGKIGSPFLIIDIPREWEDGDLSMPARVVSHEGRNRMLAVAKVLGNKPIEVHLFFSQGLRNRHITDDFKKVLNKGLVKEKSNSIIKGPLFNLNESINGFQNEAFDTEAEWVLDMDARNTQVFATKVDDAYIELTYKRIFPADVYIEFTRGGRLGVTGEGNQNKIFGAVINHIKKWVDKNNPFKIIFSALKLYGDTSRSNLYRRMIQRFASQNGYNYDVEDTSNEDTFILTRQNSAKAEERYTAREWSIISGGHSLEEAKPKTKLFDFGKY
jgi:hypothetical protein